MCDSCLINICQVKKKKNTKQNEAVIPLTPFDPDMASLLKYVNLVLPMLFLPMQYAAVDLANHFPLKSISKENQSSTFSSSFFLFVVNFVIH